VQAQCGVFSVDACNRAVMPNAVSLGTPPVPCASVTPPTIACATALALIILFTLLIPLARVAVLRVFH
jgi:hypothetical protein